MTTQSKQEDGPTREQRLWDRLKRIASYQDPEKLRRSSEREYGLGSGEAIEMAYENVLEEARSIVKQIRRPK